MTTTVEKLLRSAHQATGQWIRTDKRLAIYIRDGWRCQYCGDDLSDVRAVEVSLDHIIPSKYGGDNESDNLVTSCRRCNGMRQDKALERFASPETCRIIRRQLDKDISEYRKIARRLIDEQKKAARAR